MADFHADSASYTDVDNAVNGLGGKPVPPNGSRVLIPNGDVSWTSTLSPTSKWITIMSYQQAGLSANPTIIRQGAAATRILAWSTIDGGPADGTAGTRLSGFTFFGLGTDTVVPTVRLSGASKKVRFDHCTFHIGAQIIFEVFNVVGVCDHCIFDSRNRPGSSTVVSRINHPGWQGIGDFGDNSWATPETFGTTDVWYSEDNTFYGRTPSVLHTAWDGDQGSRMVNRFSVYGLNQDNGFQVIVSSGHGTESSQRQRSRRHTETYFNTHYISNGGTDQAVGGRAGIHIVHNNRVVFPTGSGGSLNRFHACEYFRGFPPPDGDFPPWGPLGDRPIASITHAGTACTLTTTGFHGVRPTAFSGGEGCRFEIAKLTGPAAVYNGIREAAGGDFASTLLFNMPSDPGVDVSGGSGVVRGCYDGHQDATSGYPGIDNYGWGHGDLLGALAGTQSIPINTALPATPFSYPRQSIHGSYFWSNLSGTTPQLIVSAKVLLAVKNREFFTQDSLPISATNGVNVGSKVQMQNFTPTIANSAFWVTDEGNWRKKYGLDNKEGQPADADYPQNGTSGRLYKWNGSTWVTWYGRNNGTGEPLQYPHPLIAGGEPEPPPPDIIPPVVTIVSPPPSQEFDTSANPIEVSGTASDNVGVTAVTWENDRGGSGVAIGTLSWTASNITIFPGINILTVTASDAALNSATDVLTVDYTPLPGPSIIYKLHSGRWR